MQMILDSKHISYTAVDVAADEEAKAKMTAGLKAAGKQPPYLPPQVFFGDEYIGVSLWCP